MLSGILGILLLFLPIGCAPVLTRTNLTHIRYTGTVNTPTAQEVDGWLSSVIDFWSTHYPRRDVALCLREWRFLFADDEKICQVGVCGRAITYINGGSIIGYRNQWGYVEALVGHEAGHAVLNCMGVPESVQHDEMKRVNYVHK